VTPPFPPLPPDSPDPPGSPGPFGPRPRRLPTFRALMIVDTVIFFIALMLVRSFVSSGATPIETVPVLTIAFAGGSASALYRTRKFETRTSWLERWLIVAFAFVIWIGVALAALLGPYHRTDPLSIGGFVLLGSIGWDVARDLIRRWRQRDRR
jgi:uncharacterized membrane-anchored protein